MAHNENTTGYLLAGTERREGTLERSGSGGKAIAGSVAGTGRRERYGT